MKSTEAVHDYSIILPASVNGILALFATAFNSPTMAVFVTLFAGAVLVRGRHTVTRMIVAAGIRVSHHARYHRFFSKARWRTASLWKVLAVAVVKALVRADATVWVAVDETAQRKTGSKIHGVGMVFDNRPKPRKGNDLVWGLTWVVASVIVQAPLWPGRLFAIPVSMRLYRSKRTCRRERMHFKTKPALALEMLHEIASWLPDRRIRLHVDGGYAAGCLMKKRPARMHAVGRLRADAALRSVPEYRAPRRGRPRVLGLRIPCPQDCVARQPDCWRRARVNGSWRYERQWWIAQWPAVFGRDPILIVASRRRACRHHPKPGQPQFFYSTDLSMTPEQVLEAYERRWTIERLFHDLKERMGFEDPQCRTRQAVERTTPFLVFVAGVVQYWFLSTADRALVGWQPRWNRKPADCVSFSDMLAAFRREILTEGFSHRSTPDADLKEKLWALIESAAYAA